MKTKKSSSGGKQHNSKGSSSKSTKTPKVAFKYPPALQYRWSNPLFMDLGYSLLPGKETESMVIFATHPAKPNSIWYKERNEIETKKYEDGTKFAEFYPNGSAKLFYPNGHVAISFKRNKNGYRVLVMQPGGKNSLGVPRQNSLAGIFDSLGNGVLYDEKGSVRINYTQREGILRDTPNGLPIYWKWPNVADLPEPKLEPREFLTVEEVWKIYSPEIETESQDMKLAVPRSAKSVKSEASKTKKSLQSVGSKKSSKKSLAEDKKNVISSNSIKLKQPAKTSTKITSSTYVDNSESNVEWATRLLAQLSQKEKIIEEQKQKSVKFVATPIQTVVFCINEYLSFRLVDQANIYLNFMKKKYQLRLELGVVVDPNVQLETNSVDVRIALHEKVPCAFETYLSHTNSMQKIISYLADLRKQYKVVRNF